MTSAASEVRQAGYEQIIIVKRQTELEELVGRFNTVPQARFYLEHEGHSFEPIEMAHRTFHEALESVRASVPSGIKLQIIDRDLVTRFKFLESDIIVVIGQDGLVANTAKYVGRQPIVAINPDPERFDGHLLPFVADQAAGCLRSVTTGKFEVKEVTLAKAALSDGQTLLAFNDFFVGARSHASARYKIKTGHEEERQSSSGIIVSTGAGSSGWLQSVYAGAAGVVAGIGGKTGSLPNGGRMPWNTGALVFAVREPFPSQVTGTSIVLGTVRTNSPLQITSEMTGYGRVFSDGVEDDFLEFNTGSQLTITPADYRAVLVQP